MSHTVPSQHPAVVLRSNYQHLRALLAIAIAVILGLTIAVVVLATTTNNNNHNSSLARPATQSAIPANPSTRTTDRLANYPDAPQPSVSTPDPLANYPDAPQP
jgi:hypothetical protein